MAISSKKNLYRLLGSNSFIAYLDTSGNERSTADAMMAQHMSSMKSFLCGLKYLRSVLIIFILMPNCARPAGLLNTWSYPIFYHIRRRYKRLLRASVRQELGKNVARMSLFIRTALSLLYKSIFLKLYSKKISFYTGKAHICPVFPLICPDHYCMKSKRSICTVKHGYRYCTISIF